MTREELSDLSAKATEALRKANMEWQQIGIDHWLYGEKVRGIVRSPLAEVYFDDGGKSGQSVKYARTMAWVWIVHSRLCKGTSDTLLEAIEACEHKMKQTEKQ